MLFQEGTDRTITDNLPDTPVRAAVLIVLSVAMLFTIPMILSASREIIEESVLQCT